jgi:hypothetical protein
VAIDTTNLVYLIDPFWQGENNNGRPLVGGHMEVFIAGTDTKYITWQNWDGTKNPFKIPLGSDGRATILVEPEYTYDCYLYDSFNNLAVSRLNVKPNLGGDVYGLSQVYHDDTLTGNGTVTSPLGMVSAKLGVQEPLYFVEDDSATVIGLRESAYSGLPYVENSAIELDPSGNISGISGHTFHSKTTESASIVTGGWETLNGRITGYNGSGFSAGKVYNGISPVYVDNVNDKIGVSSKDFQANSPLYFTEYSDRVELSISGLPPTPGLMYESGFNYESGKITGYNNSGISAGKVYSGVAPITVDNVNDTISVASATLGVQAPLFFVEDSESATVIGLNTAQIHTDIPESAKWEEASNVLSSNSADWNNKLDSDIYAQDSGKFLTAVPADYATTAWVTGQGYLTAHQSLEDYQTTAGMTAYLTTADSANFLTAVPTGTMNESAFSYDENNKISGYNGSAFAGGSNTSGNYIPYTGIESSLSAFTTNSGLKILRTAVGGGLNSNYMNANTLQIHLIDGPSNIIGSVLSNSQLKFVTTNDSAYVDKDKIHKWDSASDYIQNNSATISEVNTSYRTNSGNYLTAIPDTYLQNTDLTITDGKVSEISGVPLSAGSTPTYDYTDNNLISAIDTSGLFATSALEANSALWIPSGNRFDKNLVWRSGNQYVGVHEMVLNPTMSPFGNTSGIYGPLYYAQGACMTYGSSANGSQYFGGFFKGNEWYISNATAGQALRGETHGSRGVHISGATTAGRYFDLSINSVRGFNDTGSWKYGYLEDAALRAVSSCDMHESAFGYDASNNITAYNGSAFKAGDEFPQSATDAINVVTGGSANWNSTTATVNANSGAWGGSGIEISAGFGINIQLIDNKLVFSLATATGDI